MPRSQRRLIVLLVGILALLLSSAIAYMAGMAMLEGRPRGFWASLEWAAETLSTTGYGADSAWQHPLMVLFVVLVQFAGVFLVFLIVPVHLIPFLEERFEARLPREMKNLRGHVLIYRHGPAVSSLVGVLEGAGIPTVVIESDEAVARSVTARGQRVVFGSVDDGVLERVGLLSARTFITNGADDENGAAALAARHLGFERDILAVVEDPLHRRAMTLAGATSVYTPRHILGAALAARASQRLGAAVAGVQRLGRRLQVSEIRIERDCELAGKTLAEAELAARTGATVLAQWVGGRLHAARPDMPLEPGAIAVVAGGEEAVGRIARACAGAVPLRRDGAVIVAGHGEVGSKAAEILRELGETVLVIEREPGEGVDIVGDVLDTDTLEAAGVARARAIILAVESDRTTLFATVILKDIAAGVPVIARVNRARNVEHIHRAGADFALSISQVSGQMLAQRILKEEAISVDPQLKLLKVTSAGLVGGNPTGLRLRERTGCSVVAVERGDDVRVALGSEFRFEPDDVVYVCGTAEATREYVRAFPQPT